MLTRLKLKKDFRTALRFASDQSSNKDPELPNVKKVKDDKTSNTKDSLTSTAKIQELLKKMTVQSKVSSTGYKFEPVSKNPSRPPPRKKDEVVTSVQIEQNLTEAAGKVAEAIGGDVKQTEAELLSKVLGKINQSESLSDLLSGMKVSRANEADEESRRPETRGEQVKRLTTKSKQEREARPPLRRTNTADRGREFRKSAMETTTVNIFNAEPLGIFKSQDVNYGTKLDLWDTLKERELYLATAQPPANYYQKMVQWTKQGKVWQFPIDNEQGIVEEQSVHFSEHIFLDQHLEGWCPKKGPIRHFMELVCTGLSKNAFYTVQEKKDHIMWYKEYFESKKDLLVEVGAWEFTGKQDKSEAST